METILSGTIYKVLDAREGVSNTTGKSWKVQEYVIEDTHQHKCVFEVFGEDKIAEWALAVGDIVDVNVDIDAREWNGRWFNSIRAWKLERKSKTLIQALNIEKEQPKPTSTSELPF